MTSDCRVCIGIRSILPNSCEIVVTGKGKLLIGNGVTIGENVKFVLSDCDILIGDWTCIHSNSLVLAGQGVCIGMHCWFGQNSVIDGTGFLQIGNGVRVGLYSQIWTHVGAGELIEGCRLFVKKKTVIENDVWLVGTCTVGSGVTIGARTICLAGSSVTKNLPPDSTAQGSPASVRAGLNLYKKLSLDEKFLLMEKWLVEFSSINQLSFSSSSGVLSVFDAESAVHVIRDSSPTNFVDSMGLGRSATLVWLDTKTYAPVWSGLEENFVRWFAGNKARFYPLCSM